jgi:two-component system CheB/CheR fusion protein
LCRHKHNDADEASAKYDGMPKSAISTGLVDYVLPPNEMPEQIMKYINHDIKIGEEPVVLDESKIPNSLQKIFIILRAETENDFSLYKKNTICRRIERRMDVLHIDNIEDYTRYLRDSKREVGILFKELLIGVTNFFRNSAAFEALQNTALHELLKDKPDDYTIRV